jgi:hypothetical protein
MRAFRNRQRGRRSEDDEVEEVEIDFSEEEERWSEGEGSEEEAAVVARPVSVGMPREAERAGSGWGTKGRRDRSNQGGGGSSGRRRVTTAITTGGRATQPAGLRQEVESYVWTGGELNISR